LVLPFTDRRAGGTTVRSGPTHGPLLALGRGAGELCSHNYCTRPGVLTRNETRLRVCSDEGAEANASCARPKAPNPLRQCLCAFEEQRSALRRCGFELRRTGSTYFSRREKLQL